MISMVVKTGKASMLRGVKVSKPNSANQQHV